LQEEAQHSTVETKASKQCPTDLLGGGSHLRGFTAWWSWPALLAVAGAEVVAYTLLLLDLVQQHLPRRRSCLREESGGAQLCDGSHALHICDASEGRECRDRCGRPAGMSGRRGWGCGGRRGRLPTGAHAGGGARMGVTSGGGAGVDRVLDMVCMWDELGFRLFWAKVTVGRAQISRENEKFL